MTEYDDTQLIETRTAQDIEPDEALWRRVDAGEVEVLFMRDAFYDRPEAYVETVKALPDNHYRLFYHVERGWSQRHTLDVAADCELWVCTARTEISVLKVERTGEPVQYFRDMQSLKECLWVFLGEEDNWRDEFEGDISVTISRVVMTHRDLMNAEMEQE